MKYSINGDFKVGDLKLRSTILNFFLCNSGQLADVVA